LRQLRGAAEELLWGKNMIIQISKKLLTISIVAILSLGSSALLYRNLTRTPRYALFRIGKAIRDHDLETFEKYVDLDEIVDSLFDDVLAKSREELEEPADEWEKLGYDLGQGLLELMKPRLKEVLREGVRDAIEEGFGEESEDASGSVVEGKVEDDSTPPTFWDLLFKTSIEEEGKVAKVRIGSGKKEDKLVLKMRQVSGGYWRVVGLEIDDVGELMEGSSSKETEPRDTTPSEGSLEGSTLGSSEARSSYEPREARTHRVCQNGSCVVEEGDGRDTCFWSSDCYHYACSERECMKINTPGEDACTIDSDCTHKECRDERCVEVEGKGEDECVLDYSCKGPTHRECKDGECVEEEGEGEDECSWSGDCHHKECKNGECVDVDGQGEDLCIVDSDCTHSECRDGECVKVAGEGEDSCYIDSDCTRRECQGGECVEVPGEGEDECYWDDDCVHNECRDGHCVEVEGSGEDECYTDWSCED